MNRKFLKKGYLLKAKQVGKSYMEDMDKIVMEVSRKAAT